MCIWRWVAATSIALWMQTALAEDLTAADIIRNLVDNPYIAHWWPGGAERPYRPTFSGTGANRVRALGRLVSYYYMGSLIIPSLVVPAAADGPVLVGDPVVGRIRISRIRWTAPGDGGIVGGSPI